MEPADKVLNPEEWRRAHKVITAWKNDPAAELACPKCFHPGIKLVDQSARPYAEWFELSCDQCGLAVALHLPQAPRM